MIKWVGLVFGLAVTSLLLIPIAEAQQAGPRLSQTIEPIKCVFTNVETGSGQSASSSCDGRVAPALQSVVIINYQPMLLGSFSYMSTSTLRVWVGGSWFTAGASPYLLVNDGSWQLDLTNYPNRLPPGTYTVMVETLSHDSHQLTSVYVDALLIEQAPTPGLPSPQGAEPQPDSRGYKFSLRGDGTYIRVPINKPDKLPDIEYLGAGGVTIIDVAQSEHGKGYLLWGLIGPAVVLMIIAAIMSRLRQKR